MMNSSTNNKKTIPALKEALGLKDFRLFVYYASRVSPPWLIRFNSAYLMESPRPKTPFRRYSNYSFYCAGNDDIPEISEFTGLSEHVVRGRIKRGDLAYLARQIDDNRLVNIMFALRGNCFVRGMGIPLKLNDNQAYLYGGYTAPEARMKGIFNTALNDVCDILQADGVVKFYSLVEYWNNYSYQYHRGLNYQPISMISYMGLPGFRLSVSRNLQSGKRRVKLFHSPPPNFLIV